MNPDKLTATAPYTFLVASLLVLIFGAGTLVARFAANGPGQSNRRMPRLRKHKKAIITISQPIEVEKAEVAALIADDLTECLQQLRNLSDRSFV